MQNPPELNDRNEPPEPPASPPPPRLADPPPPTLEERLNKPPLIIPDPDWNDPRMKPMNWGRKKTPAAPQWIPPPLTEAEERALDDALLPPVVGPGHHLVPPIDPIIPPAPPEPLRLSTTQQHELMSAIAELAARRREALSLFIPTPEQERFLSCESPERIVFGGNRAGKTLVIAVEIARAMTGRDPHGKYSTHSLRFIVVGKDLKHCSKVLYRKMFRRGAFRIIRDRHTREWRPFVPDSPDDEMRYDESRPAPALIPERFIKEISWDNKREEIPTTIRFKNGGELSFFSSQAAPPQGWDADAALFDEEIVHPRWYEECAARLLDRRVFDYKTKKVKNGKFIWSATPQAGTQLLYSLVTKAETCAEEHLPIPAISAFRMNMEENKYVSSASKEEFKGKFDPDSDEYRVRVLGDFALLGQKIYPGFMPRGIHGMEVMPIPEDWTRYAFIDPGYQVTAVLFVAIPHPKHQLAGHKVIYDELYLKRCDAVRFAAMLKAKIGESHIEAWWIDHRAGRMTQVAAGKTPEEQYSEEFRKIDLKCNRYGYRFGWASDDVDGGILAVRDGLVIRNGRSEWLVMHENLKNFIFEASIYAYRRNPDGLVTDSPLKLNDHLMDTWRYAAMAKLDYVKPPVKKPKEGYTHKILKAKRLRAAAKSAKYGWGSSIKLG